MSIYRPLIVSHRGAKREAPENTITAYEKALSYPIDGIELDVQLTRNGIPVIYHDRTLWKIAGSQKRVLNYSFDDLEKMDFGIWFGSEHKGEKIPTLNQVLDNYLKKTRLFIEIKSRGWDRRAGASEKLTQEVIDCLEKYNTCKECQEFYILSFDRTVLEMAMKARPLWNYVLTVISPGHYTAEDTGKFNDVRGICTNINRLTYKFADMVHKQGKKLLVYTCNTPEQLKKAVKAESDAILTDDPQWLFGYIKKEKPL